MPFDPTTIIFNEAPAIPTKKITWRSGIYQIGFYSEKKTAPEGAAFAIEWLVWAASESFYSGPRLQLKASEIFYVLFGS